MEKRVIDVISKVSKCDNIVNSDALKQLGIDSLSLVELIIQLEDEFDLEFEDSSLSMKRLRTVEDVINLVIDSTSI